MSTSLFPLEVLGCEYDELWEEIREYGASTPSPPAPAVQEPVRPPNQARTSTRNSAYYAREENPFENQFGQALEANSPQYFGPPTPFLAPAVTPAGSPPAIPAFLPAGLPDILPTAAPAATAAVSQAVIPANNPAGHSQQPSRSNTQNNRRRQGLWRLYSSFATVFAETETSQSRREAWQQSLVNVRQILPIDDDQDSQPNSGEASSQEGTSNNSSNGGDQDPQPTSHRKQPLNPAAPPTTTDPHPTQIRRKPKKKSGKVSIANRTEDVKQTGKE